MNTHIFSWSPNLHFHSTCAQSLSSLVLHKFYRSKILHPKNICDTFLVLTSQIHHLRLPMNLVTCRASLTMQTIRMFIFNILSYIQSPLSLPTKSKSHNIDSKIFTTQTLQKGPNCCQFFKIFMTQTLPNG